MKANNPGQDPNCISTKLVPNSYSRLRNYVIFSGSTIFDVRTQRRIAFRETRETLRKTPLPVVSVGKKNEEFGAVWLSKVQGAVQGST